VEFDGSNNTVLGPSISSQIGLPVTSLTLSPGDIDLLAHTDAGGHGQLHLRPRRHDDLHPHGHARHYDAREAGGRPQLPDFSAKDSTACPFPTRATSTVARLDLGWWLLTAVISRAAANRPQGRSGQHLRRRCQPARFHGDGLAGVGRQRDRHRHEHPVHRYGRGTSPPGTLLLRAAQTLNLAPYSAENPQRASRPG